jgi:sugar phosphate isomerase/epimerase
LVDVVTLEVGLQMWTVREQMAADALRCLSQVADAGYRGVELVGYGNVGFEALRDGLGEAGLRAVSQHVAYRRLDHELELVIAENVALGCEYVVIQQGRHDDWVDDSAVVAFAATCTSWARSFRDAGLALGYHGYHELDLEFAAAGNGTRWDLFAETIDPELLFLQLDTYWVRHTGQDPVAMLGRFGGRVPLLHLKDTSTVPGETDTAVGNGLMDLPAVLAAASSAGTRWLFVEQEGDPAHAFGDIRRSRDNVVRALETF